MSFTIYPNQFKMRDNGQYVGLNAIKGDTGETGPAGRGIGEGEFTPLVYYDAERPTNGVNNSMWVKGSSSFTLGEVMVGPTSTTPTTRPNGNSLQAGDLYVMGGKGNNHPTVWGNVTFYPFRCWVYSGSAWVYKDAEVRYNNDWYPMNSEWFVENGVIIGELIYRGSGIPSYEAGSSNGELVLSLKTTSSSGSIVCTTAGNNVDMSTNPFTNVIEGTLYNGHGNGKFGSIDESYGGGTAATNYGLGFTINRYATVNNPMFFSSTNSSQTCCFHLSSAGISIGGTVARIKNWYRVFADITGV